MLGFAPSKCSRFCINNLCIDASTSPVSSYHVIRFGFFPQNLVEFYRLVTASLVNEIISRFYVKLSFLWSLFQFSNDHCTCSEKIRDVFIEQHQLMASFMDEYLIWSETSSMSKKCTTSLIALHTVYYERFAISGKLNSVLLPFQLRWIWCAMLLSGYFNSSERYDGNDILTMAYMICIL